MDPILSSTPLCLAPPPQVIHAFQNVVPFPSTLSYVGGSDRICAYLARQLSQERVQLQEGSENNATLSLKVEPDLIEHEQGYKLTISQDGITITGHDEQGLFYGVTTFLQIIQEADRIEGAFIVSEIHIEDWPDFLHRGVHFDISRDKVPTLETLKALIDKLASWKINQLQFNIEHAFAYEGHERVWKNASPLTKEDVLHLDRYCQERFIEFVPNQNSLAHLHRWLMHRKYRHLSESPSQIDSKVLTRQHYHHEGQSGYSLCPTIPESKQFIEDLYGQIMPLFLSRQCHVGLDEAVDLAQGGERSKSIIDKDGGSQRVFKDWLMFLRETAQKHGKEKMQMWADGILFEEEILNTLPNDVIPVLWGYEDEFPFELGKRFSDRNLTWYVAPSTCTWNSIGGRSSDAINNLSQAAEKGLQARASGYLITEWGDNGHHHPLGVSYLGLLAGACFSWKVHPAKEAEQLDISYLLNKHVFKDKTGHMGTLAYQLGELFRIAVHEKSRLSCCSALFRLLVFNENLPDSQVVRSLSSEGLNRVGEYLKASKEMLDSSQMTSDEAPILMAEFTTAIELLDCARIFGQLLLENPTAKQAADLPEQERNSLKEKLNKAIAGYKKTWLLRNREGGLSDSVRRLDHLVQVLSPSTRATILRRVKRAASPVSPKSTRKKPSPQTSVRYVR